MIRRMTLLAAALLALGLAACGYDLGQVAGLQGSGHVKSESRDVHDFDRVELAGIGTVNITQGTAEALTVRAEDNLLPKIESVVRGGTLTLGPVAGVNLRPSKPIVFDLTVKQLRGIEVASSGDVRASGLTTDQLLLSMSGSGSMNTSRISAGTLTVQLSGSGDVTVSGQASRQMVTISGSGRYAAGDLSSRQAVVSVPGSGSSAVNVSDTLTAIISGSGDVTYRGNPAIQRHITGSGSVTRSG
jgi:hypothetical protein